MSLLLPPWVPTAKDDSPFFLNPQNTISSDNLSPDRRAVQLHQRKRLLSRCGHFLRFNALPAPSSVEGHG